MGVDQIVVAMVGVGERGYVKCACLFVLYMHKFVHVHAHFNFALLRKFYGVFSYKNKSAATCRSLSHLHHAGHNSLINPPPHRRTAAKLRCAVALPRCLRNGNETRFRFQTRCRRR